LQQAESEVSSLYTKKLETGYFKNVKEIDEFAKTKPMLASQHENHTYDFKNNMYYSQPKIDGIRCIARKDGLWTRTGKEIVSIPHIGKELKNFFEKYPDAIIDGELYNHDLKDDFNKITSLVRKTKPKQYDYVETQKLVQYHIYDMVNMPEKEKTFYGKNPFFSDRISWLKDELLNSFSVNDTFIKFVPTLAVYDMEQLDKLYGEYLEYGYEGQMIRINAVYQEDKRSKYLIKRKEFLSEEFPVLEMTEGQGNWAGHIKQLVLQLPDERKFGAGIRGTQEVLSNLYKNGKKPDWATVRYFTPTPDGIPRFPVVVDWGYGTRND
jgi:ATP-dependent DNA ligase